MTIQFSDNSTELETFRTIILYGANTASYKFALGQALLELPIEKRSFVRLDELAVPFYKHMVQHVLSGKKQTSANSSKYLYACQLFSEGKLTEDEIIALTVSTGFQYVIDAFPKLKKEYGQGAQFYTKSVIDNVKGITIDDSLYRLRELAQASNLSEEVEGRWNLVESSWDAKGDKLIIEYDDTEKLFCGRRIQSNNSYLNSHIRAPVTHARKPLSGYQTGKCFYCFDDISIVPNQANTAAVDHFFPISLQYKAGTDINLNLNGIWNLVLTCKDCNGEDAWSKWAHTPDYSLLPALMRRNDYYISSKHPLGETIQLETGNTASQRKNYIKEVFKVAKQATPYEWKPRLIKGVPF